MYNYKTGCFITVILLSAFLIFTTSQNGKIVSGIVLSILLFWLFKKIFYTTENEKMEIEERNKKYEEARKNREIIKMKAIEELKKIKIERMMTEWNKYYKKENFSFVDKLSGLEFEEFLYKLLKEKCYSDIRLTDETGDQGIDILFKDKDGKKVGIQAKRYTSSVGNSAVQQLLGGMLYYNCQKGIIATTSKFTQPAIELANKDSRIILWDRNKIEQIYSEVIPTNIPIFSLEKAKQIGLNNRVSVSNYEISEIFKKYGLDPSYDYKYSDLDL